jgi:hypothetical protein
LALLRFVRLPLAEIASGRSLRHLSEFSHGGGGVLRAKRGAWDQVVPQVDDRAGSARRPPCWCLSSDSKGSTMGRRRCVTQVAKRPKP